MFSVSSQNLETITEIVPYIPERLEILCPVRFHAAMILPPSLHPSLTPQWSTHQNAVLEQKALIVLLKYLVVLILISIPTPVQLQSGGAEYGILHSNVREGHSISCFQLQDLANVFHHFYLPVAYHRLIRVFGELG